MPNHLHAIIELRKPTDIPTDEYVLTHGGVIVQTDGGDISQTVDDDIVSHDDDVLSYGGDDVVTFHYTNKKPNNFYRKPKSISSFIAGYKSVINTKIDDYIDEHNLGMPKYNRNNHFFQPNYYDHIIRNMIDKFYLCPSKAGIAQW